MIARVLDVPPLLLSFENVRLLGPDGLILAISAAVIAITWRTVRSVPVETYAEQAGAAATAPPDARAAAGAVGKHAESSAVPGRATAFGALVIALLLLWAGVRLLAQPDAVRMGLFLAILGVGAIVWLDRHAERAAAPAGQTGGPGAMSAPAGQTPGWNIVLPRAEGNLRWLLAGAPIFLTLIVWRLNRARPLFEDHTDIALLWLLAIGTSLIAVAWPLRRPDLTALARVKAERGWLLIISAVLLLAGALRLLNPAGYPWVFSGDEGQFGWEARRVLEGTQQNPFGTGFLSHPNLFFYAQAWSLEIFGNDVAGLRILSGLMGVAAVLVVMLYARHRFGPLEGIVAGVVLATLHHHIFLSRTALNNIGDALFLPLSLWLVERGVFGRRRLDSLLAGMVLGGSQYFYFGSRLLPIIAAAVIATGVLFQRDRSIAGILARARALAPYVALTVAGAIVVLTPFLAYFIDHSIEANARMRSVSIFSSGWLDGEIERTGRSAGWIIAHRIWDCLLLPFHGNVHGFYRPGAPYVGVALAVPVALGLGICAAGFWRRRYAGLAIAYVAASASLALTEGGLYQSNRYSGAAALFALLAAVGFGALVRIMIRLVGIDGRLVLAALAASVGMIGAWNVDFFFRDDNQVELYSDHNTQVANTLAYELNEIGPGVTVYFAAPPVMWYAGFANIDFIAPDAVGISLDEPWDPAGRPPALTGTTLFVFLPDRIDELDVVRRWFPNGSLREVRGYNDALLYYEYRVEPEAT